MTAYRFVAVLYAAHVAQVAGSDAALIAFASLLALGALCSRAAHVFLGSVAESHAANPSGADAATTSSGAIALLPALTRRCRVSTRSAAPDHLHPGSHPGRLPPSAAGTGGTT